MIFEKPNEEFFQFRIPGLILTENNTLLSCYECRRFCEGNHDWSMIDLRVRRSTDEGKTWETVLQIESRGNTMNNPVLIAAEGKVYFLYCENYRKLFCRISTDDGKTRKTAKRPRQSTPTTKCTVQLRWQLVRRTLRKRWNIPTPMIF